MPETICTTVYQFSELSDAAKDKARSWYRELGPHDDWWDAVYEDFGRICDIIGIRLKTTTVYVTHDQIEAMTMAHRIVVLNKGRIEQFGTPMELYHHPATRFVATFIGQPNMNLVPATVLGADASGLAVELEGGL